MGGGAIKHPALRTSITGRLPLAPYTAVKRFVLDQLAARGIVAETVLELPGKQSFGDLDVLYVHSAPSLDMGAVATEVCRLALPWHVVTNGRVMSCAFDWQPAVQWSAQAPAADPAATDGTAAALPQYFQVDFIATPTPTVLDAARFYFSYGDVGSIIGRLANHYSLKFGDIGLFCDVLEHTANPDCKFDVRHTVGKLVLCSDPRAVCQFLGLDYTFWEQTIPRLAPGEWNPIFQWVEASPLFKRRIFLSLNSDHRARYDLRPFYRGFVEHLGITELTLADASLSESGGAEENMQPLAMEHFGKTAEMHALYVQVLADRARNAKFRGGDLFAAYTTALGHAAPKGQAAGALIDAFQRFCTGLPPAAAAEDARRSPATTPPPEGAKSDSDEDGGGVVGQRERKGAMARVLLVPWRTYLDGSTREDVLARVDAFVAQLKAAAS